MNSPQAGRWVFEPVNPMGGARATAWRDPLEGSDLPVKARIAREAIQNSVDATLPNQKTELLVWDKTLSATETADLAEILSLDSPDSPTGRISDLGLKGGNSFERIVSGEGEIRLTIIEDRNTCGLGFDDIEKKDRFKELCLFLGQEETTVQGIRGGSYGFGKTVYQASSDCRTFLVYSVFQSSPETEGTHARLFGCSSFNGHSKDGKEYTGRAWFGVPGWVQSGLGVCEPLTDDCAHAMAQRLGFMKREAHDLGTSIMILGSDMNMDEFREAIEDYWWPRIVSDQLSVELWMGDEILPPPEPLLRPELKPFIRCYQLLEFDLEAGENERNRKLNAADGVKKGGIALKALTSEAYQDQEEPTHDSHFRDTVALVRSGPRMVVQYMDTGGRLQSSFAGTFVSHSDSEEALHLSEPPSHSSWNPNSDRLKSADPSLQQLVGSILDSIKRIARRFQKELSPPQPPLPVSGTRKLEEVLARVMSAKGLGPTPTPGPVDDPFEIRINEGRTNSQGKSKVTVSTLVRLRQDAPIASGTVLVSIRPSVVLDDNKRRESSERLNLARILVDDEEIEFNGDPQVEIFISKSSFVSIAAESESFDRDLYADLEILVSMSETTEDHPPEKSA